MQKQLDTAYQKGVQDFKKSAVDLQKSMQTEVNTSKEFNKSSDQGRKDASKVDMAKAETTAPSFIKELSDMKKNIFETSADLKNSAINLQNDVKKNADKLKQKEQRVIMDKPKLR